MKRSDIKELLLTQKKWIAEFAWIVLLPAVMFVICRPSPMNQAGFIDPYLYTGYIQNFRDLYDRFGLTYYSVRFGLIAPGRLLTILFGPEAGYFVQSYLFYLLAGGALYLAMRKFFSVLGAAAAYAVFVGSPWVARAILWQYPDGAVVAYVTAANALILLQPTVHRRTAMVAVGALLGLAVNSQFFALSLCGLSFVLYLLVWRDLPWRERAIGGFSIGLGALLVQLLGTLLYGLEVGEWNLLEPTLRLVRLGLGGLGETYRPARAQDWIYGMPWIVFPFAVLAWLAVARNRLSAQPRLMSAILLHGALSLAFFVLWNFRGVVFALFFYFSMLIPATMLGVCALVASQLAPHATRGWHAMLLCGALVLLPAVWPAMGRAPEAVGWFGFVALIALPVPLIMNRRLPLAIPACLALALAAQGAFSGRFVEEPDLRSPDFHPEFYNWQKPHELDVFRIAAQLIERMPRFRDDGKALLFWYPEGEDRPSALPNLDSIQSVYLWGYSRFHKPGERTKWPELSTSSRAILRSPEPMHLAVLGTAEQIAAARKSVAAEPIELNSELRESLCSGETCVAMEMFNVSPRQSDDEFKGVRWTPTFTPAVSLRSELEVNLYGFFGKRKAISDQGGLLRFRPTSREDHLATKFFELPGSRNSRRFIRIRASPGTGATTGACRLLVQDESFGTIGRLPCKPPRADRDIIATLPIEGAVIKARLVFISQTGQPITLPSTVTAESGVGPADQ